MRKTRLLGRGAWGAAAVAAAALGVAGCWGVNKRHPKPLNYDEMGLETHHRGLMGSPEVGAPEEERIGHDTLDKLRAPGKKGGTGAPAPASGAPSAATAAPAPPPLAAPPDAPSFGGKLDKGVVRAALRAHAAAIDGCFEKAKDDAGGATVVMEGAADAGGKVTGAKLVPTTAPSHGVEACLASVLDGVTIAGAGGAGTFVWPFKWTPPEPAADPVVTYAGKSDLSKDAVKSALVLAEKSVHGCYEKALAAKEGLGGTLAVKLVVGKDSKVASAELGASTIGDADVEKCAIDAVKALAFPKAKGGGTVNVTATWRLTPGAVR
ncbi:MAG TPA: AgmX/PglI C-terminal domain-containing protein [Myxococcota bacterium]|jgi:hypothetical protein|nr:AgmX/PglI C-terminal domain-containing protein [Myxococcota bacterium]